MQPKISPMGPVEWALLLLLSLLWGGSYFFAKVAVGELPPLTVVLMRVAIASAALVVVLHALGHRLPSSRTKWRDLAIMGLLNNVLPFSLFIWGLTEVASGLAAILNATTPLFTVLVANVFTDDEKMNAGKLAGVVLGLAGVAALIGFEALQGLGLAVLAQIACLAAAVLYAVSGVWARRFRGDPPIVTAGAQLLTSTVMMLPIVLLADRPWELAMPSAAALGAVVGLALVSTALAYVIFFRILATAGATNLLLVTFLIPVTALLLGAVFLDERVGANAFLGMAMIGLGLAAIDGRPARLIASRFRARAGDSRR